MFLGFRERKTRRNPQVSRGQRLLTPTSYEVNCREAPPAESNRSERKGDFMKAFLEEYGISLFVISVVLLLIGIAEPVSSVIQDAMITVISDFAGSALNG